MEFKQFNEVDVQKQLDRLKAQIKMIERDRDYKKQQVDQIYSFE